jgi:hypothetical protein
LEYLDGYTSREETKVLGNGMLKRIIAAKKKGLTRGWSNCIMNNFIL